MSFQPDPYTTPQHQHSHYQHQQYRSHLTVPTVQIDPLQHIKQQPQPEAREINLNPPPGDRKRYACIAVKENLKTDCTTNNHHSLFALFLFNLV